MGEFILEEQIENVTDKNTKEYLKEVVSSYNYGNYRATIVVLYTAIIYDLLQKMVVLKEIYNDQGAEKILNEVKEQQNRHPRKSEWEGSLIENIYKETKLITAVEKEELLYIKSERNYAAHPIINIDDENEKLELKYITKETARDLIRKAFEIVFLKDAILAKKIVEDIVIDLNIFYERVNTDGLESFLNTKYFQRMTQERKDELFKCLWKFVFIINDEDCNKNRESNYWGLVFLYNKNKIQYQNLIKKDENFYFNKIELETIRSWSKKNNTDVTQYNINYYNKSSRIMCLIKFIWQSPELYKILNDYSKNILQQSINHMFIEDDVVEKMLSQCGNKSGYLFKEQVKLKSETVFLSEDISQHFDMIFKMIQNYTRTKIYDWTDVDNYYILDDNNLDIIFHQSEYRGCIKEFLTFLIEYCTEAQQFWQTTHLFNSLKRYRKYFEKEHFYIILTRMNSNSQYYRNDYKGTFLNELEKMFIERFDMELLKEKEEKYLYNKLYQFDINSKDYKLERILELIERRALLYSVWDLKTLIFDFLDNYADKLCLKNKNSYDYPNILSALSNNKDANYNSHYIEKFNKYFE